MGKNAQSDVPTLWVTFKISTWEPHPPPCHGDGDWATVMGADPTGHIRYLHTRPIYRTIN
eukprot:3742587-Ditylum_brightwellii.AAC.1